MSDDKAPKANDGPSTAPQVENGELPLAQDLDLGFHPIEIRGEPLSQTILRERR
jgi:hypothetical protein